MTTTTTAADDLPGRAVDPDLLRVISRVAHREHLFGGPARPSTLATATRHSTNRHRPVTVSDAVRPARGTTARKVTWSR